MCSKGSVRNCCWPITEVGIFCLGNAVHPRSFGLMLVCSPNQRNFALEQAAVFTSPAAAPQPTQLIFTHNTSSDLGIIARLANNRGPSFLFLLPLE